MERTLTLAQHIASLIETRHNCVKSGNSEWLAKHTERLESLRYYLPSGSGIDGGCSFNLDASNGNRIVILTQFHHMNESGFYDGWTAHTVTVTPNFTGFNINISGRDRNQIKDYLADTFDMALRQLITETAEGYSIATDAVDAA